VNAALANRAEIVVSQIAGHVTGGDFLDIGCGDGQIGALLAKRGVAVTLTDVYEHPVVLTHGLPFRLFRQGEWLPFESGTFASAALITVLHHSDNPVRSLQEARRVLRPGGRLIVIESEFGLEFCKHVPAQLNEMTRLFLSLTGEEQRLLNIVFDHFYNRVVHHSPESNGKVNVPYNQGAPLTWERLFKAEGFTIDEVEYLGIDQPVVPEYHVLYVLSAI
jgi:SAM-dependent methyltransferase